MWCIAQLVWYIVRFIFCRSNTPPSYFHILRNQFIANWTRLSPLCEVHKFSSFSTCVKWPWERMRAHWLRSLDVQRSPSGVTDLSFCTLYLMFVKLQLSNDWWTDWDSCSIVGPDQVTSGGWSTCERLDDPWCEQGCSVSYNPLFKLISVSFWLTEVYIYCGLYDCALCEIVSRSQTFPPFLYADVKNGGNVAVWVRETMYEKSAVVKLAIFYTSQCYLTWSCTLPVPLSVKAGWIAKKNSKMSRSAVPGFSGIFLPDVSQPTKTWGPRVSALRNR